MKQTTTAATNKFLSTANDNDMGHGNRKGVVSSVSADEINRQSLKIINKNDVNKWTSAEVQQWIKQQCNKFELKKTVADKFEINGQALVLLTKNDFLRRSPDGEVLYYALQRLISPNKINRTRVDPNSSNHQHPRIVELSGDQEELHGVYDSSPSQPIIEEPDDPPVIRRSQSATHQTNDSTAQAQHSFFARNERFRQPFVPMHPAFVQQQAYPHVIGHGHHYAPHIHQQYIHPHLMHQYYPMMSAQGILIEVVDEFNRNANATNQQEKPLYMVTMNGQRLIMNEVQVTQLVNEIYQRLNYEIPQTFVLYQ